jgi:hypothetical protein
MRLVPFDLPPGCKVLLVGAGGGFDFVCGLPVAFELEARGHTVHLANYSFSLVWYFDADAVARAKPYYREALGSQTIEDMARLIEETRRRLGVRDYEKIPI